MSEVKYSYRYLDPHGNIVLMENEVSARKVESELQSVDKEKYNIVTEERFGPDMRVYHVVYYIQRK